MYSCSFLCLFPFRFVMRLKVKKNYKATEEANTRLVHIPPHSQISTPQDKPLSTH